MSHRLVHEKLAEGFSLRPFWSNRCVEERYRLEPARRRALELLPGPTGGCAESITRAQGFSIDVMVELVRAGLPAVTAECVVSGPITIEVAPMRITDAARRAFRW